MTDQGFPRIIYAPGDTPRQWGRAHGETYRAGIRELAAIRTRLLRARSPWLDDERLTKLARAQWQATLTYDRLLGEELEGIRDGAAVSITDLVVLNNYTDFRDIRAEADGSDGNAALAGTSAGDAAMVDDAGCTVVYAQYDGRAIAGQTWDMHASAKNYIASIEIPIDHEGRRLQMFSLVGCMGLMGFAPRGAMVGVNNLNSRGARPGVLWPAVVRKVLSQPDHASMVRELTSAPVTSGHNYLLAAPDRAEMWEVMPGLSQRVAAQAAGQDGFLFHTNHCVGERTVAREDIAARSATTLIRYDLVEKKMPAVRSLDDLRRLLEDHDNYPLGICSHFQSGAADPSQTCGGAVGDLTTGEIHMWRGCRQYDANFASRGAACGKG